jgi:hypothetical protein
LPKEVKESEGLILPSIIPFVLWKFIVASKKWEGQDKTEE